MNMSDHRKSASMQTEDFILEVKIEWTTAFPSLYLYVFSCHLIYLIKSKMLVMNLLLYKCSCVVIRKDDIFQLMFLFIEEKSGQICFLPSHTVLFSLMALFFLSLLTSFQSSKIILCQAKKTFANHCPLLDLLTLHLPL